MLTYIIMMSMALASNNCQTQESAAEEQERLEIKTDVPAHLKGATIIIRRADGKETSAPAELFKVVPRKQQYIVTKTQKTKVVSCVNNAPNKNRISVLGGRGSLGTLNTSNNGNLATVESEVGAVGGLQYQRLLTERLSVGVQGQSNNTASVVIGIDF